MNEYHRRATIVTGWGNGSGAGNRVPLKLTGAMTLLQINVRLIAAGQPIAMVVGELFHDFRWGAEYKASWRNDCAFGDDRTRADNASFADHCPVEDNRADADQAIILDLGAVDDGAMADGDALADCAGNAGVGVEDGAVLDVGVFVDGYEVGVGADYGGGPDAGSFG